MTDETKPLETNPINAVVDLLKSTNAKTAMIEITDINGAVVRVTIEIDRKKK